MLTGKNVLLGVSGGIAAYKMADVASKLVKLGADVHVIMTKNAEKIITKEAFEVLTKNRVYTDTFAENSFDAGFVPHINLAGNADIMLIAPATANIIGKIANGIADDMLSTTFLAATCPIMVAPAMNVYMYENRAVQHNLDVLRERGIYVIEPDSGHLACGYDGKGKLPTPDALVEHIVHMIAYEKDMVGKKVLVTAGPTEEALDPVRFITNHSSGKMGYALASVASMRGAEVTLVTGPTVLDTPLAVNRVDVKSAEEMYQAVMKEADSTDIFVMSAAVADYTPAVVADNKIKKKDGDMSIPLNRTKDILKSIGERKKEGQFICGFSMETDNLLENSRNKLESKNADMICANSLTEEGAGYKVDTNIVTIITKDAEKKLPLMSKTDVAVRIFDEIMDKWVYK